MAGAPGHPVLTCMALVNGYQVSSAIYAALELGVFDRLRQPAASDAIAEEIGVDGRALYRLLRALASAGVLSETDGRNFSLTPVGDCLRSDSPGSVAAWAAATGRPYYWQAWGHLLHSVRTGQSAFAHVHGVGAWEYRQRHLEDAERFNRAMTAMSQRLSHAVARAVDFGRFSCLVDVGGGAGALLSVVLRRHPRLRGVLFDRPEVVADADTVLRAAGVLDRVRCVGGTFFGEIPPDGDAYVLCSVLHNWDDDRAVEILRSCRRATRPEARLFVAESQVGPPNQDPSVKFLDLNMLVIHGGLERTAEEFRALLAAAGFELVRSTPTASPITVIEARPV